MASHVQRKMRASFCHQQTFFVKKVVKIVVIAIARVVIAKAVTQTAAMIKAARIKPTDSFLYSSIQIRRGIYAPS